MDALTEDQAKTIMTGRGYSYVAEIMSGSRGKVLCFSKQVTILGLIINANVELKSASIEIIFQDLAYFCKLSTGRFDLYHKDFDKIEQIMYSYAAKAMELDVFAVLDSWKQSKDNLAYSEKPKKTLKERKLEFWEEIRTVAKKKDYSKIECEKFYNHWTQQNPGSKKMWFEKLRTTKTFDTPKRLVTWMGNAKDWDTNKKNFIDKKVDEQNQNLKKDSKVIDPSELF